MNRAEKIMWNPSYIEKFKTTKDIPNKYNNPNVKEGAYHIRFSDYPWSSKDQDYYYYESWIHKEFFKNSFFIRATRLAKQIFKE